jgi:SAM-dependent methyltransferase
MVNTAANRFLKRPLDPNELRKLARPLRALCWRLPLELSQLLARLTFTPVIRCCDTNVLKEYIPQRGATFPDTTVTSGQRELLLRAVQATDNLDLPIVELGAWRGVTTAAIAKATQRPFYVVDPYCDPSGDEADLRAMHERTRELPNVKHIRMSSGEAARALRRESFSVVFVDAIHDYLNTWFDFKVWGSLLSPGGMIAFHDVDDHAGANLACRRILKASRFALWGYCPNLAIFERK